MIGILFMILYLTGWIASATLFREVFQRKDIKAFGKIMLCLYLLVFSWIGYFTYILVIKVMLNGRAAKRG